jgi:hypothetical protein
VENNEWRLLEIKTCGLEGLPRLPQFLQFFTPKSWMLYFSQSVTGVVLALSWCRPSHAMPIRDRSEIGSCVCASTVS